MAEQTVGTLTWTGGLSFVAHSASGHEVVTESVARPGHRGPSPIELFLLGIGGCTAIDVVAILEKMREPLRSMQVEVVASRSDTHPKYFTSLEIIYTLRGPGLSREKVERAVQLSNSTYCSAVATLRPDCAVTTRVVLEAEVEQPALLGEP